MTRGGRILISEQVLLDWLQFKEGRLWGVQWNEDGRVLELAIEHPDMPEVERGAPLQAIYPGYTSLFSEDGTLVRIERISPKAEDAKTS